MSAKEKNNIPSGTTDTQNGSQIQESQASNSSNAKDEGSVKKVLPTSSNNTNAEQMAASRGVSPTLPNQKGKVNQQQVYMDPSQQMSQMAISSRQQQQQANGNQGQVLPQQQQFGMPTNNVAMPWVQPPPFIPSQVPNFNESQGNMYNNRLSPMQMQQIYLAQQQQYAQQMQQQTSHNNTAAVAQQMQQVQQQQQQYAQQQYHMWLAAQMNNQQNMYGGPPPHFHSGGPYMPNMPVGYGMYGQMSPPRSPKGGNRHHSKYNNSNMKSKYHKHKRNSKNKYMMNNNQRGSNSVGSNKSMKMYNNNSAAAVNNDPNSINHTTGATVSNNINNGNLKKKKKGGTKSPKRNRPIDPAFKIDVEKLKSKEEKRTTMMVRNIPNRFTKDGMITEFNQYFEGEYDFFYLPIDFNNKCNVGYAFINFKNSGSMIKFYERYEGKTWPHFKSSKICAISYARLQGREAMLKHFEDSGGGERNFHLTCYHSNSNAKTSDGKPLDANGDNSNSSNSINSSNTTVSNNDDNDQQEISNSNKNDNIGLNIDQEDEDGQISGDVDDNNKEVTTADDEKTI